MKVWSVLATALRALLPLVAWLVGRVRGVARHPSAPTASIAVILAICSWSPRAYFSETWLDTSWEVAMHLARVQHLHFGSEIAFTYGPLGFLESPLVVDAWLCFLSTLYLLGLHALLAYLIMRRVPVRMGLFGRAAIAMIVLLTLRLRFFFTELAPIDGFLVALALLEDERPARFWIRAGMAFAAAGCLQLLVKFGTGITLLAMGALVAVNAPNRSLRGLASWAGSGAVTLLAAWLVLGQRLVDLPRWLALSQQFLAGYTEAMSIIPESTGFRPLELALGLTAGVLLILALALRRAGPRPRRTKILTVLLAVGCVGYFAKQGFVRHDFHSHVYFIFLLTAGLTLPMLAQRPVTFGVANLALFALFLTSQDRGIPLNADQIVASVKGFAEQIRILVSTDYRNNVTSRQLAGLRASLSVPDVIVNKIGQSTIHFDPWMTCAAWAYGFHWKPVPVFQRYAAFTPALDAENAKALADSRSPQAILLHKNRTIDRRHPLFESPAYALARLCHYRVADDQGNWQLLQRTENRCGPERESQTVSAKEGLAIKIPEAQAPNGVVVAHIRAQARLGTKLADLLLHSPERFTIEVDGRSHDLPIALGEGPLVLRTPANAPVPELSAHYNQIVLRGFTGSAQVRFAEIALSPSSPW